MMKKVTYLDLEEQASQNKKLSDEFDIIIQKLESIDKSLGIMKSQILFLAGSIEILKDTEYNSLVDTNPNLHSKN